MHYCAVLAEYGFQSLVPSQAQASYNLYKVRSFIKNVKPFASMLWNEVIYGDFCKTFALHISTGFPLLRQISSSLRRQYQQSHHMSLLEALNKKLLPIRTRTSFCIHGREAALLHETAPRCCASCSWCRKGVVNVLQVRGHSQKAEPQRNSGIVLSRVSVPVTHTHSRRWVWPWVLGLHPSAWHTGKLFFFSFLISVHHEKNVSVYGSGKSLTLNLELAGKGHTEMLWGWGYCFMWTSAGIDGILSTGLGCITVFCSHWNSGIEITC